MGVKKSTVCIKTVPLFKRTAAASSAPSNPMRTLSFFGVFKFSKTSDRSPGPILHAHPEPWLNKVNLIFSLSFIFGI